jgi:hypothetical protein
MPKGSPLDTRKMGRVAHLADTDAEREEEMLPDRDRVTEAEPEGVAVLQGDTEHVTVTVPVLVGDGDMLHVTQGHTQHHASFGSNGSRTHNTHASMGTG